MKAIAQNIASMATASGSEVVQMTVVLICLVIICIISTVIGVFIERNVRNGKVQDIVIIPFIMISFGTWLGAIILALQLFVGLLSRL